MLCSCEIEVTLNGTTLMCNTEGAQRCVRCGRKMCASCADNLDCKDGSKHLFPVTEAEA